MVVDLYRPLQEVFSYNSRLISIWYCEINKLKFILLNMKCFYKNTTIIIFVQLFVSNLFITGLMWFMIAQIMPVIFINGKLCVHFYLFRVLRRFQHCTGHITTGSWKGRGNQYIQFVRVLYCKLPTNGKQLPAFPLEAVPEPNPGLRGGRRECYHSATVVPNCVYKKTV